MLMAVAVLSSCALGNAGRKLQLSYAPSPQSVPGLHSKTFSIQVTDRRPYVTHGKKVPSYLGIYRGGYGNPFDVVNYGKVALADQMKVDLRSEFQALGLVETAASASKQVSVRIHDWNFDAGIDARFWYDVELSVADFEGKQLATSRAKAEMVIKGNAFAGPHSAMQKEIPVRYGELIRKLVREDSSILSALRVER